MSRPPAPRRRRELAPLLALGVAAAPLPAQAPSPWATLAVPGGVVPSQLTSIGKLVAYHDGATLHAFSAVTRAWHAWASPNPGPLRANNDCLLLQGSGTWLAFASYTGRFAPLAVGAGAVLHNGVGASNDSVLLVGAGPLLHAFSAFTGAWTTRTVPASHLVAVQRHVAVLVAGSTVGGFDAFTGQWTDLTVPVAPGVASADGTAGFAYGSGTIHAFSASRRAWVSTTEPASSTFERADDWGLWYGPGGVTAYGALHGAFERTTAPATAVAAVQDVYALVLGPQGVFAFSALTNSISRALAAPAASIAASTCVALLTDGNGTRAYDAVHGRAVAAPAAAGNGGVANVVAWVDTAGGPPLFFSALTGAWHRAPAAVLPGPPLLTTTAAACATNTGALAFAPRSGRFVPLVEPTAVLHGNPASAPLLALGATTTHAFDARTERWVGVPHARSAPNVQIWRTAAVVVDGTTALGFGSQAASWSAAALPAVPIAIRANSESARVSTANEVLAWSAIGEVAWLAQFPEFRRVQPAGAPARLVLRVPPGGVAALALGPVAPAPVPLAALGELQLVPAQLAAVAVVALPSGEPVVIDAGVPGAALAGVPFGAQALLLAPGGASWLSDLAVVWPH